MMDQRKKRKQHTRTKTTKATVQLEWDPPTQPKGTMESPEDRETEPSKNGGHCYQHRGGGGQGGQTKRAEVQKKKKKKVCGRPVLVEESMNKSKEKYAD